MLTIAQIINKVDPGRLDRSEYVRITRLKYGLSKQTKLPKAVALAYSKRENYISPARYTCLVKAIDDKGNVKLSCSCPDFTFHGYEYNLYRRGAADIIYGNGERPTVNNYGVGCCKHLVMLINELFVQKKLDKLLNFKDAVKPKGGTKR